MSAYAWRRTICLFLWKCWFKANYLTLNPSKSNFVIFHTDRKLVPSLRSGLTKGGQKFVKITVNIFLRVVLDKCPKFGRHVKKFLVKYQGIHQN